MLFIAILRIEQLDSNTMASKTVPNLVIKYNELRRDIYNSRRLTRLIAFTVKNANQYTQIPEMWH